jgi:hypothetical protein
MSVTTYKANSLPMTINECGNSVTLNDFFLQFGTVPGTSITLITHMYFNGSMQGTSADFTLQVLSITKSA